MLLASNPWLLVPQVGSSSGRHPSIPVLMTITVGRLLAYVSGLLAGVVLFLGWSWFGPSPQSFADKAEAICKQEAPAIGNARHFQTAMAHSREMRLRLSVLTPPAAQQKLFSQWMADLRASEKAGAGGKKGLAWRYDAGAQLDVRGLGLSDRCLYHLH
jgi:hypothetical protein